MSYDLGTAHGSIEIDYDGAREVTKAERDMDRLERKSKDVDREMKRLGDTLGDVFGGAAKGGALTLLGTSLIGAGAAAANLVVELLGIVPALASIASLSAALPSIFVAMLGSVAVLQAAFMGMGDALKEAFNTESTAKFDEALKKLAPNARAFAQAFKDDAVPALKDLQQGIQDAFFSNNFEALLPRLTSGLASMRPTLEGLASDFGRVGRTIAAFVVDSDLSWEFLDNSITTLRGNLAKLEPAIVPLLTGLRSVGEVGLPLFDRLGTAVAELALSFGNWLEDIANSGQLQAWIDEAISTLKTLGGILQNVGGILSSVFSAAEATGGGLLQTIETVTGAFNDFLNTAEGQAAITGFFTAIADVASALTPIITTLAGALATALGPAFSQIANEVGPVLLEVANAIAPALTPIASALADVMSAVAPLLPPIAKLASLLATQLATGLSALAAELGPTIEVLGGAFLDALVALEPIFTEIAALALPLAANLGTELLAALAPLAPVIVQVAQAFTDAILPVLPELVALVGQLAPLIADLAVQFGDSLAQALLAVIPYIPMLVDAFVTLAPVLLSVVTTGLRLVTFLISLGASIAGFITGAIERFNAFRNGVSTAFNAAVTFVQTGIQRIVGFFTGLPGRIGAAIAALPGVILRLIQRALNGAATAIGFGLGLWVGLVARAPQRIGAALAGLAGQMAERIQAAWSRAQALFSAGINRAVALARGLPGRVRAAIAALPGQIASVATSAWSRAVAAFNSGVARAVAAARALPGRVRGALGNLGGALVGAGAALINGLISGISSGIGRVMGMVSGLASRVRSAFSSALQIFSPSRVFMEFGMNIDEGLIEGLKKKMGAVYRTAQELAKTAIQPTIDLGSVASYLTRGIPRPHPAVDTDPLSGRSRAEFGPYQLVLDGKVVSAFVVDTITGNPRVVSKANTEGARQAAFA